MAENDLDGPVLGVSWDGTGYGPDGTIWGGEFLLRRRHAASTRVASLRPFRLPGGEHAVREPRRAALGLLYALARTGISRNALHRALGRGVHAGRELALVLDDAATGRSTRP